MQVSWLTLHQYTIKGRIDQQLTHLFKDGPYGETPREEEGSADLERFFDDHLGASEKEGMDKENLPSNIVAQYLLNPKRLPEGPLKEGNHSPNDQDPLESRRTAYNAPYGGHPATR